MSADTPKLAIRGQMPTSVRASQTQKLTKGADTPVKARVGATVMSHGKINPAATRPGMHVSTGPQPFVSKGRIDSPATEHGALTDAQLKKHATSSKGSFGVSFTQMEGTGSQGYQSQLAFNKAEFGALKGKSFITSTAVDSMQQNPHSSGLETELIARGHMHADDQSMMQHTIGKRKEGGFSLSSSMWQPATADSAAGWGAEGEKKSFDTFDDAFERMNRRGVAGATHFDE
jgi:hypothetical protein